MSQQFTLSRSLFANLMSPAFAIRILSASRIPFFALSQIGFGSIPFGFFVFHHFVPESIGRGWHLRRIHLCLLLSRTRFQLNEKFQSWHRTWHDDVKGRVLDQPLLQGGHGRRVWSAQHRVRGRVHHQQVVLRHVQGNAVRLKTNQ